jgi:Fungal chitosanase of glycosyl hydrolase group 75
LKNYLLAVPFLLSTFVQAETACSFKKWDKYQGSQLLREKPKGAYIFATNEVKVDADGAPNAYHPDDVGLHCIKDTSFKGLDCPANGGYPNSTWWRSAIVPDPKNKNKGYIQPNGDFKGFFVSQTSLKNKSKTDLDITKYVNSTDVPYFVSPGTFYSKPGTGSLGDIGYAINLENGKASSFIIAEVGPPKAHLGEMSIFLGSALGGSNPNPRTGTGVPVGKVVYVIFPSSKSSPAWPVTQEEINTKVKSLLNTIGGIETLKKCANAI